VGGKDEKSVDGFHIIERMKRGKNVVIRRKRREE
jgi:hypothetical protein